MLDRFINLIEKDPKKAAGIWLLFCSFVCLLISLPLVGILILMKAYRPQVQEQTQTTVSSPVEQQSEQPFDRTKCKVYYAGVLLGANVFWFHNGSSGTYLMFTDSNQLVDKAQNRGINIWLTKSDFLNLLGNDLMQEMEPDVKEVFASRLDGSSHVAVVDESLVTRAIGAADNCVR
jgi:hypothetical protein